MTRIAINEALQLLRQRRPEALWIDENDGDSGAGGSLNLSDKHPTPEQTLAKREMRCVLVRAISKLRPRLRAVILLREVHGLEYAEMAQHLGLSMSAVKARTLKARRVLRRRLACKYEGGRAALQKRSYNHGF
jgi:RNA polymerase sigma-70 factor, ECF subfamily